MSRSPIGRLLGRALGLISVAHILEGLNNGVARTIAAKAGGVIDRYGLDEDNPADLNAAYVVALKNTTGPNGGLHDKTIQLSENDNERVAGLIGLLRVNKLVVR